MNWERDRNRNRYARIVIFGSRTSLPTPIEIRHGDIDG